MSKVCSKKYTRDVTDCYKNIIFLIAHRIRIQTFSVLTERCSTSCQLHSRHSRNRWFTEEVNLNWIIIFKTRFSRIIQRYGCFKNTVLQIRQ